MLKAIINFGVFKLKSRRINFDNSLSNRDLLYILLRYSIQLLIGFCHFFKLVPVGKGCNIYKVSVARGVSIGQYVSMDGTGINRIYIGKSSSIGSHSILSVSGTLTSLGSGIFIGDNVGVGDFSHIGGAGGVEIGDDTIIGAYFSVHPENHCFQDKKELIRLQGVTRQGIKVGKNCWIGAKVTLLDGSIIGNGCVIAAGAVVRGVFPDNVVIGGVPARVLKER